MDSKEKIVITAKTLFATKGFANVSMRYLAKELAISPAAIYHHFPDKQALYLETMRHAFANKASAFSKVWLQALSTEEKLVLFVTLLIHEMTADPEFHRLIIREIIDANPERMKLLANEIFKEQFSFLVSLMKDIAPEKDAHLSAISVLSLCKHHIEMKPLRQHLAGWKAEHENPDVLTQHVIEILLKGLSL